MQEKYWWLTNNKLLLRTIYGKTIKGAVIHLFNLSNRQLIITKNQLNKPFISSCGDNLSGKIIEVEQLSPQV